MGSGWGRQVQLWFCGLQRTWGGDMWAEPRMGKPFFSSIAPLPGLLHLMLFTDDFFCRFRTCWSVLFLAGVLWLSTKIFLVFAIPWKYESLTSKTGNNPFLLLIATQTALLMSGIQRQPIETHCPISFVSLFFEALFNATLTWSPYSMLLWRDIEIVTLYWHWMLGREWEVVECACLALIA